LSTAFTEEMMMMMMKNVVAVTSSKVPVLSTCISGGVHISRCTGGLRLSGFSSWCVMAMSGELAQHGVSDGQVKNMWGGQT